MERRCHPRVSRKGESIISGKFMHIANKCSCWYILFSAWCIYVCCTWPNGDIVLMVQVNQWLTWLETAEEEESEGEDFWGTGQSHVISGCKGRFFFIFFFFQLCNFSFSGGGGVCFCPSLSQTNWFPSLVYEYFQPLLQFIPLKYFARSSQHRHHLIVFMLSFLIFNLIWCPTADVLYILIILGYVFFTVGSIVQGKLYQHQKSDPFYHLLHLESPSAAITIKNCLQKRKDFNTLQRGFSRCFIYIC